MRQSRLWIPIVAVFAILVVISFFRSAPDHRTAISYGDVLAAAHSGKLEGVTVRGDELHVRLRGDATDYESRIGPATDGRP